MFPNETCKTSRLKSAAEILMDLQSNLINVEYNREIFHMKFSEGVLESHNKVDGSF